MHPQQRLPRTFYNSDDVVRIARSLLGHSLCTHLDGHFTAGRIVETEAYRGPDDKASHAYGNRRTARTEPMFGTPGVAYVYLCYGIHHLFNVVTAGPGTPHAVLVRAVEPVAGTDIMLQRRGLTTPHPRLTAGPGTLSQALGIRTRHTGTDLTAEDSPIWIAAGDVIPDEQIISSPRVGVDYAAECAEWPWRFRIAGNRWCSPAK
ncbi:MAG: DNA-3-methyladenine glycosylase [Saprospiraceae bacterium]|nr:DNA-3-methyladenine glycosylase [Saprospiraceae bacterium]